MIAPSAEGESERRGGVLSLRSGRARRGDAEVERHTDTNPSLSRSQRRTDDYCNQSTASERVVKMQMSISSSLTLFPLSRSIRMAFLIICIGCGPTLR